MNNINKDRDLYDEISKLINIPDIMHILDSSEFFVKEYLKQKFKQSSRWEIDKIHPNSGVKLKASNEKILKNEHKTSLRHRMLAYKRSMAYLPDLELKNFIEEEKPKLRYFTQNPNKIAYGRPYLPSLEDSAPEDSNHCINRPCALYPPGEVVCFRCKAHQNIFCKWHNGGRDWTCNICEMYNKFEDREWARRRALESASKPEF